MDAVKETGGARIGMANATWPFATLTVTKDQLELASILGKLVFRSSDIVSIEPYSGFLSRGLKINHRVTTYKRNVIFWTFGNLNNLINRIEETGFLNNKLNHPITPYIENQISAAQLNSGFPIRKSAIITIGIIWNILFLIDFIRLFINLSGKHTNGSPLGIGSQLAFSFILLVCVLLLTTESVRRIILKEGLTIDDIKKLVYFIMIICGFILLVSIIMH